MIYPPPHPQKKVDLERVIHEIEVKLGLGQMLQDLHEKKNIYKSKVW